MNLIIDYDIVYAVLTSWLVVANAGRVWGLDGWLAERRSAHRGLSLWLVLTKRTAPGGLAENVRPIAFGCS